jgi:(p)ppGpp synthase/HD superfamily hydrolase
VANLEEAILLAVQSHRGQKDKSGAPYILHPLRLMLQQKDEVTMAVAILHDVVEDTPVTLEQLREAGFAEEIVTAVACLTHDPQDTYEDYVAKIKTNSVARAVKLSDLEDNMRLQRMPSLTGKDWARLQRYHRAWQDLRLP